MSDKIEHLKKKNYSQLLKYHHSQHLSLLESRWDPLWSNAPWKIWQHFTIVDKPLKISVLDKAWTIEGLAIVPTVQSEKKLCSQNRKEREDRIS